MGTEDTAPGKARLKQYSAPDVICVSWVAQKGEAGVSSLPPSDIKAIWLNETGKAQCTSALGQS